MTGKALENQKKIVIKSINESYMHMQEYLVMLIAASKVEKGEFALSQDNVTEIVKYGQKLKNAVLEFENNLTHIENSKKEFLEQDIKKALLEISAELLKKHPGMEVSPKNLGGTGGYSVHGFVLLSTAGTVSAKSRILARVLVDSSSSDGLKIGVEVLKDKDHELLNADIIGKIKAAFKQDIKLKESEVIGG